MQTFLKKGIDVLQKLNVDRCPFVNMEKKWAPIWPFVFYKCEAPRRGLVRGCSENINHNLCEAYEKSSVVEK